MGNANKLIYSKEEYLYYHINRKEYSKVEEILNKNPQLIDKPITKDTKHTLLMRAAFSMNLQSVQFVLSKGANPNIITPKGQSALTIAIRKNSLQIVQRLIQSGANVNVQTKNGLKPIDLAVLQGLMEISKILYNKMNPKELKQIFQYEDLGKKYQYRYVNYKIFLKLLLNEEEGVQCQGETNYLQQERVVLYDPVPDPRESWGEWFKRTANFKDGPLVQRSSLPEELQPQNRVIGKLDVMVHNLTKSDAQKKTQYKPKQGREVMSEMNDLIDKKAKPEGAPDYQSAI